MDYWYGEQLEKNGSWKLETERDDTIECCFPGDQGQIKTCITIEGAYPTGDNPTTQSPDFTHDFSYCIIFCIIL